MSDRRYQWRGGCVDDVGNGRDRHDTRTVETVEFEVLYRNSVHTDVAAVRSHISSRTDAQGKCMSSHSNDVVR